MFTGDQKKVVFLASTLPLFSPTSETVFSVAKIDEMMM